MDKQNTCPTVKKILFLLCQYPWDTKNNGVLLELIKEVTDWNGLVNVINSQGIIALSTHNILQSGLENEIPITYWNMLKNSMYQNIMRNSWLLKQWEEVDRILESAGIKYVLLKGMALEHTIYDSKGLRQISDIDIFIENDQAFNAWTLLQEKGFIRDISKSHLFKYIKPYYGNHYPSLSKKGYYVEIHDKLLIDNSIYERCKSMEILINGRKALVPDPKFHLQFLKNHFQSHAKVGECYLKHYADIVLLDPNHHHTFPEEFLTKPHEDGFKYRKEIFRRNFRYLNFKQTLIFIIGDIFPDLSWMKERYRCSSFFAVLRYPLRFLKLLWLI